jgi:hypothetical protein
VTRHERGWRLSALSSSNSALKLTDETVARKSNSFVRQLNLLALADRGDFGMPMTLTRSLLTILIPGLIAISPWLLILVQYTSATLGFGEFTTLANALVFASAAVAGTFFEAQGANLEVSWDRKLDSKHQVKENWLIYLSRAVEREPVGYRYVSRLATTLCFELAMIYAMPIFVGGVCTLAALRFPGFVWVVAIGGVILTVASSVYFYCQARCTHDVLCETRKELNIRTAS